MAEKSMPALPETAYQLYYEWPDDEDGYGGSEVIDSDGYTADQMHTYAQQYAEQRVAEAVEAIAREWDGCTYEVACLGEVDIGAAIRRQRSKQ